MSALHSIIKYIVQEHDMVICHFLYVSRMLGLSLMSINVSLLIGTVRLIEVGFTQDYKSIIEACRSWLEGTATVRLCVVFFEEIPSYTVRRMR
jgi:hypothetical protein